MDALSLIAEERICQAVTDGELDGLPGAGRPLVVERSPFVPDDLRMAYTILRNSGYLPPEIVQRKEVDSLLEMLGGDTDEGRKLAALRRLEAILFDMRRKGHDSPIGEQSAYADAVLEKLAALRR